MGSVASSTKRLSVRQSNGRISNSVADFLRQKLTVPEVYLKPRMPGVDGVDVLAVDHAGSGDVHGVEILYGQDVFTRRDISSVITRVRELPLHFKYVALPGSLPDEASIVEPFVGARGFDASGIGRIGLIFYSPSLFDEASATDANAVTLIVKPERFLLRGERLASVERFLSKAKPDMSVRI